MLRLTCSHSNCKEKKKDYSTSTFVEHLAFHAREHTGNNDAFAFYCSKCHGRFVTRLHAEEHAHTTNHQVLPYVTQIFGRSTGGLEFARLLKTCGAVVEPKSVSEQGQKKDAQNGETRSNCESRQIPRTPRNERDQRTPDFRPGAQFGYPNLNAQDSQLLNRTRWNSRENGSHDERSPYSPRTPGTSDFRTPPGTPGRGQFGFTNWNGPDVENTNRMGRIPQNDSSAERRPRTPTTPSGTSAKTPQGTPGRAQFGINNPSAHRDEPFNWSGRNYPNYSNDERRSYTLTTPATSSNRTPLGTPGNGQHPYPNQDAHGAQLTNRIGRASQNDSRDERRSYAPSSPVGTSGLGAVPGTPRSGQIAYSNPDVQDAQSTNTIGRVSDSDSRDEIRQYSPRTPGTPTFGSLRTTPRRPYLRSQTPHPHVAQLFNSMGTDSQNDNRRPTISAGTPGFTEAPGTPGSVSELPLHKSPFSGARTTIPASKRLNFTIKNQETNNTVPTTSSAKFESRAPEARKKKPEYELNLRDVMMDDSPLADEIILGDSPMQEEDSRQTIDIMNKDQNSKSEATTSRPGTSRRRSPVSRPFRSIVDDSKTSNRQRRHTESSANRRNSRSRSRSRERDQKRYRTVSEYLQRDVPPAMSNISDWCTNARRLEEEEEEAEKASTSRNEGQRPPKKLLNMLDSPRREANPRNRSRSWKNRDLERNYERNKESRNYRNERNKESRNYRNERSRGSGGRRDEERRFQSYRGTFRRGRSRSRSTSRNTVDRMKEAINKKTSSNIPSKAADRSTRSFSRSPRSATP